MDTTSCPAAGYPWGVVDGVDVGPAEAVLDAGCAVGVELEPEEDAAEVEPLPALVPDEPPADEAGVPLFELVDEPLPETGVTDPVTELVAGLTAECELVPSAAPSAGKSSMASSSGAIEPPVAAASTG